MTEREKQARKRLKGKTWDGLEPMLEEYAAAAREIAHHTFREELGWTTDSLEPLERILDQLCPAPAEDTEWLTLLWGSYFGELLRRLHGGNWAMTIYPKSDGSAELSVPTLERNGSRLYPMMKVHRRLTLGPTEGIPAFYDMLVTRLGTVPLPIH